MHIGVEMRLQEGSPTNGRSKLFARYNSVETRLVPRLKCHGDLPYWETSTVYRVATMDERINEWARQQAIEQNKGTVFCDLMLKAEEAVALERLVIELRDSGLHEALGGVFAQILEEIERDREIEANGGSPWTKKKS